MSKILTVYNKNMQVVSTLNYSSLSVEKSLEELRLVKYYLTGTGSIAVLVIG